MTKKNHNLKKYEHAVIAVDTVILRLKKNQLQVLLIQMNKEPYTGLWAAPGGLIGGNESLEDAVKRTLETKTGLELNYFEQLHTFGDVGRDPFGRVVSVAYLIPLPPIDLDISTSEQYKDIQWFDFRKLPKLAYDHKEIITRGVERLRSKLDYSNIVTTLLPKYFTLTQLQTAYETILGKKLDKRNFRKKVVLLKLVKPTNFYDTSRPNRPAQMFTAGSSRIHSSRVLS